MCSQSGGNLRLVLLMNAIAASQRLTAFSWCSQGVFAFNVELVISISSFTSWMLLVMPMNSVPLALGSSSYPSSSYQGSTVHTFMSSVIPMAF